LTVTIDTITQPSNSDVLITDSDKATKILLAIGENQIITLMEMYGILEKVNLKTGEISYSTALQSYLSNAITIEHNLQVIERQRAKGGNLAFTVLYTKDTESEGSRHLYMRRFVIDPTDLTVVSAGDEIQFGGDLLHRAPWSEFPPIYLDTNHFLIGHWRDSTILLIDLIAKSVKKSPDYTPVNTYGACPMGIFRDQATGNLALLLGRHYWITGSYSYINLVNPRDWSQIVANSSYDPGNGAFLQRMCYRDSTGKVRLILYGASGGYSYTSYTSKWNSLYVSNDDLAREFVVTANSSYGTFESGNRCPHVLGVRSDGKLQLIVYGRSWGSVSSFGVSCLDVDDTLGTPANLVEKIQSISTSEYSARMTNWVDVFLLESDWNYYVWAGTITVNDSPTNVVFRISGVPDLVDYDPYGYILVPRTGLIPTNLTLQAMIT